LDRDVSAQPAISRVLAIGPKGVGKSTLIERLRGSPDCFDLIEVDSDGDLSVRALAAHALPLDAVLVVSEATAGMYQHVRRDVLACAAMGARFVLFVMGKMDTVDSSSTVFRDFERQTKQLLGDLEQFGAPLLVHSVVPASALDGDNVTVDSQKMRWYAGPTIVGWLRRGVAESSSARGPCRVVCRRRVADSGRIEGTVLSGALNVGDQMVLLPSGSTTRVTAIEADGTRPNLRSPGMDLVITLSDAVRMDAGDLLAPTADRPECTDQFKARLFWVDANPLYASRQYLYSAAVGNASAEVTRVLNRVDPATYSRLAAHSAGPGDIAEVELHLSRPFAFDPYRVNRETGSFLLLDKESRAPVGRGVILHSLRRATNVHWQRETVGRKERASVKGQTPAVIWLTGLSGSGKSTIANATERRLIDAGWHTMLLDGDNIRHGLNRDLGFTAADRIENIRRIGEVAKLMADAGLIVIAAFISPFRAERELVRSLLPDREFIEVYVSTPVEICERRDPKGLYRKARSGEIPNFTGVNAPYEPPAHPELVADTTEKTADEIADAIIMNLRARMVLSA
jgi:bifunctional enzyme CysN/CysC